MDAIERLQAAMLTLPQYEPETQTVFHGGMYLRAVGRPKGCLIVGKRHLKDHFYMVMSGKVGLVNAAGDVAEIYEAGRVIPCKAGTKRAVLALEDSVCLTVHVCDATTDEAAEAMLVEPDPTSPFLPGNRLRALT